MSAPEMPFDVGAYKEDTAHLTGAEDGAYLNLLLTMWAQGGTLPNNEARLAQIAKFPLDQWRQMAPTILAFFIVVGDHLEHRRINHDLPIAKEKQKKAIALSAKRAAAGKRGGRPPKNAPKPLKNGHDKAIAFEAEKQKANAYGLLSDEADSRPGLFPQESFPPNPPSKNPPNSTSQSVKRAGARDKISKKTHVLVRNALETVLSPDMAQAVIQHRNITVKKPLTERAAKELAVEFGKAKETAGVSADEAALFMIKKGWRGFEAEWAIPRPIDHQRSATGPPAAAPDNDYSEENLRRIAEQIEAKERARQAR